MFAKVLRSRAHRGEGGGGDGLLSTVQIEKKRGANEFIGGKLKEKFSKLLRKILWKKSLLILWLKDEINRRWLNYSLLS